jgi:hypothetical protein
MGGPACTLEFRGRDYERTNEKKGGLWRQRKSKGIVNFRNQRGVYVLFAENREASTVHAVDFDVIPRSAVAEA